MTHAYNAPVHDSTGFSPFFLMFGRHPRLSIGAFLGIPQDTETTRSQEDYMLSDSNNVLMLLIS